MVVITLMGDTNRQQTKIKHGHSHVIKLSPIDGFNVQVMMVIGRV